jgi:hypothetical protein
MYRFFVVQKGGRDRDPFSGKYRSRTFILTLNLAVAFASWFYVYPLMETYISNFCANNSFNIFLLLSIGLVVYYKLLKP